MDLKDADFRYLLKHVEECEEHHEDCKAKITIRCPLTKDDLKARDEHCKKYPKHVTTHVKTCQKMSKKCRQMSKEMSQQKKNEKHVKKHVENSSVRVRSLPPFFFVSKKKHPFIKKHAFRVRSLPPGLFFLQKNTPL